MADLRSKGSLMPEFRRGSCTSLLNDTNIWSDSLMDESPNATLLHDMIGDDLARIFHFQVDFCHYASVSTVNHFIDWVCDYHHRFGDH